MKNWNMSSVLLTGLSHIREDTPCQDHVEIGKLENGVAAALADGVGSLKYSHYASMLATQTTVAWLRSNAEALFAMSDEQERKEYIIRNLLEQIQTALEQQAQRQQLELRQLDCNLAFCLLDAEKEMAILGQIGDCAICLLADDAGIGIRERRSLVISDRSGLANSTCTVMSSSAAQRMTVTLVNLNKRACKGILMTSDGLEGVVYRKNSTLVRQETQEIFNKIAPVQDPGSRNSRLEQLIGRIREDSRGYLDDDISMILLSRGDTPLTLAQDPRWLCRCGHRNPLDVTYCVQCGSDLLRQYRDVDFSAQEHGMDGYFLNHQEQEPEPEPASPEPPVIPVPVSPPVVQEPAQTMPEPKTYEVTEHLPPAETGTSHTARPERIPVPKKKPSAKKSGKIGNASELYAGAVSAKAPAAADPAEKPQEAGTIPVQKAPPAKPEATPEPAKNRPNPVLTGILILAMVLLLLMLLMHLRDWVRGTSPEPQESRPEPTVIQTQPQTDDRYLRLGEDRYYIGELLGNQPHGSGTLVDGTTVYSGVFENGKKNGIFTVTELGDSTICRVVKFCDDRQEEILYNSELTLERIRYQVTRPMDTLYKSADYSAERQTVKLEQGAIVYGTATPNVTAEHSGTVWVEIELMDGTIGWCTSGFLTEIYENPQESPED